MKSTVFDIRASDKEAIAAEDIDFLQEAEAQIREKHKATSAESTPISFIKKRPDGFDYVDEAYMRAKLNHLCPIWSWLPAGSNPVQFLGVETVVVCGILEIIENGVKRQFFSPGAARIQFKREQEHILENVLDVDKNVASANTNAFKRAMNRLENIADDVYRKHIEDPALSEGEANSLLFLAKDLGSEAYKKIKMLIANQEIDKTNLAHSLAKLKYQNEQKQQDNGKEGE